MAAPVLAHLAARGAAAADDREPQPRARRGARARSFGAEAIGLAEAMARLAEFDIVVSCTASPVPMIGLGAVERARQGAPAPADADGRSGGAARHRAGGRARSTDVYLYTIDDLAQLVQAGSDKRSAAVGQAETIIEAGVKDFVRWLEHAPDACR